MGLAVLITIQNQSKFHRDLNEIMTKNDKPELNIAGHMPSELKAHRLTVTPSAHTPSSQLDIATNDAISSFNSSSTDLGTAAARPSEEQDDFPMAVTEAIALVNSSFICRARWNHFWGQRKS